MGLFADITDPYSAFESWFYDRVIAPVVPGIVRAFTEQLPELPEAPAILDVGCGGGQNALIFAEHYPGAHVTGLDLSKEQIARARRRTRGRDHTFTWIVGSALDMDLPDDSFDLALSLGSLKHWPDPGRGVREMVRVTRRGGTVVIAELDRGCRYEDAHDFVARIVPRPLVPVFLAMFRTWVAGRSLSCDEARQLMDGLPVRDVDMGTVPGLPAFKLSAQVA